MTHELGDIEECGWSDCRKVLVLPSDPQKKNILVDQAGRRCHVGVYDLGTDEKTDENFDPTRHLHPLRGVTHPNIARVLRVRHDKELGRVFLMGEGGETVADRLGLPPPGDPTPRDVKPMSHSLVEGIVRDVACALSHLKHCGFRHGDISPWTIFLTGENRAKLGAFPIAREFWPQCAAPEQWEADETGEDVPYGPPQDVYGLGSTAAWMLNGEMQEGEPDFPGVPRRLAALVWEMLHGVPGDRPTAVQVEAILKPDPVVVWRDEKVATPFITTELRRLENLFRDPPRRVSFVTVRNDEEAKEVVDRIGTMKRVWIVTNRNNDGEKFVRKRRDWGLRTPALVFCGNDDGWVEQEDVIISTEPGAVEDFVKTRVLEQM